MPFSWSNWALAMFRSSNYRERCKHQAMRSLEQEVEPRRTLAANICGHLPITNHFRHFDLALTILKLSSQFFTSFCVKNWGHLGANGHDETVQRRTAKWDGCCETPSNCWVRAQWQPCPRGRTEAQRSPLKGLTFVVDGVLRFKDHSGRCFFELQDLLICRGPSPKKDLNSLEPQVIKSVKTHRDLQKSKHE